MNRACWCGAHFVDITDTDRRHGVTRTCGRSICTPDRARHRPPLHNDDLIAAAVLTLVGSIVKGRNPIPRLEALDELEALTGRPA